MRMDYSISPDGEKFRLPDEDAYKKEFQRLKRLAAKERKAGREIVGCPMVTLGNNDFEIVLNVSKIIQCRTEATYTQLTIILHFIYCRN